MEVTQELLKRRYVYNFVTGVLTRRYRPLSDCPDLKSQTQWNRQLSKPIMNTDNNGYIRTMVEGKAYRLQNLIWLYVTGEWPIHTIDHIRGIKTDNRWSQIRDTPDNALNQSKRSTNKSGVTGVHWRNREQIWQASICKNYKEIDLGRTRDFFEACCRRKSAELKFGFHKNHGRSK